MGSSIGGSRREARRGPCGGRAEFRLSDVKNNTVVYRLRLGANQLAPRIFADPDVDPLRIGKPTRAHASASFPVATGSIPHEEGTGFAVLRDSAFIRTSNQEALVSRNTYKGGRKRQSRPPQAIVSRRKPKSGGDPAEVANSKDAEISRLARELAEAQAKLREIEATSTESYTARKMESLLEAAQIARGQAFDASLARNQAVGRLRALERAILEARGPSGWLLRRAARRVLAQASTTDDN